MQEEKRAGKKKLAGRKYLDGEDTDQGAAGERLVDEECSEAFLCRVTGEENLSVVRNLTLTIDTNVTQVDHLGILMPRLTELRLERGSTLASFRDLGSSLANLRVLWLSACGIRHVDGVGALAALEELYLAFNDVDDLTSIALHDRLEVLDLESNLLEEAEQAMHLGTCPRLWSLTLASNPLCRNRHYRREVVDAVPQLALLDEEDVTDSDRCPPPLPGEKPPDNLRAESTRAPSPCKSLRKGANAVSGLFREIPNEHPASKLKARPTGLTAMSSDAQLLHGDEGRVTSRGRGTCPRPLPGARTDLTEEENARSRRRHRGKGSGAGTARGQSPSWLAESRSLGNLRRTVAGQSSLRLSEKDARGSDQDAGKGLDVVAANVAQEASTLLGICEGRRSTRAVHTASRVAAEKVRSSGASRELECAGEARREGVWLGTRQKEVDADGVECGQRTEHRGGALPVDEEQLVAEAVKTFRLYSTSKAMRLFTDSEREPCAGGDEVSTTNAGDRQMFGVMPLLVPNQGTESAHTAVGRLDREEGGSGAGSRRSAGMRGRALEENDWLLKLLRLQGITFGGCGRWASPERSTASSTLTHGSEVSIAGNPAFGLRRRRPPEESADRATARQHPPPNFEPERTASTDVASEGGTNLHRPAKPNRGRQSSACTRTGNHACRGTGTMWSIGEGNRRCRDTDGGEEIVRSDSRRPLSAGEAATDAHEGTVLVSRGPPSNLACDVSRNESSGREEPRQEAASLFCRALLSPPLRQKWQYLTTETFAREAVCAGSAGDIHAESDSCGERGTTRCGNGGTVQDRRARGTAEGSASPNTERCTVAHGQGSDREVPESSSATTVSGGGGNADWAAGSGSCFSHDAYDDGISRQSVNGERRTRASSYCWKPYATGTDSSSTTRTHRENSSARSALELDRSTETAVRETPVTVTPWLAYPASKVGTRLRRQRGNRRGSWNAVHNQPVEQASQEAGGTGGSDRRLSEVGDGALKDDDTLVALLRQRPKNVPQIRTREAFSYFFRGMDQERLGRLLRTAYADCGPAECDAKVKKRLMLMERSWAPLPKDVLPGLELDIL